MGAITQFPEFVPNQVLTNTQLNQLREHLDQQDRATRVRLVGTGIVCGLSWTIGADQKQIVISSGYGVTSDGFLIELPDSTFTGVHPYSDPDVDEQKKPRYPLWSTPQITVEELIEQSVMQDPKKRPKDAQALPGGPLGDWVLLLYLEREEVNLKSCLVTDCDNKGLNIRLNVRVLRVEVRDLAQVPPCAPARDMLYVPRLHTKKALSSISTAAQLYDAYAAIAREAAIELEKGLTGALQTFDGLLNLEQMYGARIAQIAQKLAPLGQSAAPVAQYHYDAVKDLARAHNEFLSAACELVQKCGQGLSYPRHLMAGALDGTTPRFRHEFAPAAAKNVMHGELERVRKLFERIVVMAESLDFTSPGKILGTPSHLEGNALGSRAMPFYYKPAALKDLWQPKLCCTTESLWQYGSQEPAANLSHRYADATFVRIEGHLGVQCQTALDQVRALRQENNAEFEVMLANFQDPDPDQKARMDQILSIETKRHDRAEALGNVIWDAIGKNTPLANVPEIAGLADQIRKFERDLLLSGANWAQVRCARRLHCDAGALQEDYVELRASLICELHQLLGHVSKLRDQALALGFDDAARTRALSLSPYILEATSERITAAAQARRKVEPKPGELISTIDKQLARAQTEPEILVCLALWAASMTAGDNAQAFIDGYLPKRLCEAEWWLTLGRYKELVSDLSRLLLLASLCEFVFSEEDAAVLPDSPAPGGFEWKHIIAALMRAVADCFPGRLASIGAQYETLRRNDLTLFTRLAAAVGGLEHTAGVEKGGTFVLVCDRDVNSGAQTVVADLSLVGRPACCCALDPNAVCLPPVALADYRVVVLREDAKGGYSPVDIELDVLANDYDPNRAQPTDEDEVPKDRGIKLTDLPKKSDLGAALAYKDGLVTYQLKNPQPGRIDRFIYRIAAESKSCPGTDSAEVLIAFVPEVREEPGAIAGVVTRNGKAFQGAKVILSSVGGQATTPSVTNGKFAFDDLKAGAYLLQAQAGQSWSQTETRMLAAGQSVEDVVLKVVQGDLKGTIGTITRAASAFNSYPVKGATVTVGNQSALTQADGTAKFTNLDFGDYTLLARAPGFRAASATAQIGEAMPNGVANFSLEPTKPLMPILAALIEAVTTGLNVSPEEAEKRLRETHGDRYIVRLVGLTDALASLEANDSAIVKATTSFVVRCYAEPSRTEDAAMQELDALVGAVLNSFSSASGERKQALGDTLGAAAMAMLDSLTLTLPDTLSVGGRKIVDRLLATLPKAGIEVAAFRTAWAGERLGVDLRLRVPKMIVELLR